jgi:hypothetical protein
MRVVTSSIIIAFADVRRLLNLALLAERQSGQTVLGLEIELIHDVATGVDVVFVIRKKGLHHHRLKEEAETV